jgi:hypothetical protein
MRNGTPEGVSFRDYLASQVRTTQSASVNCDGPWEFSFYVCVCVCVCVMLFDLFSASNEKRTLNFSFAGAQRADGACQHLSARCHPPARPHALGPPSSLTAACALVAWHVAEHAADRGLRTQHHRSNVLPRSHTIALVHTSRQPAPPCAHPKSATRPG